jgi:hypothetical protein
VLLTATPAQAQLTRPSVFAIDTTASVDEAVDANGNFATGVIVDGVVSADLGGGVQAIVRPFLQRLTSGEWNRQVWVAEIRYERQGDIGIRIDAGLIPSPIGLANMTLRPHLNPTIAQPASLFTPLPTTLPRGPRLNLIGAVYPFGVQVTASTLLWDVRAAVIDTSPLRVRRIFADVNPPRFVQSVVGAGVTPIVGLRIGTSVTHGGWQRANESPLVTDDRGATIVTVESEFSFRHTKLAGEWVRDSLESAGDNIVASGWFVHGQQTLAPRWFFAGRIERMSAPGPVVGRQRFAGTEEVIGYRVTPDLTFRVGHRARAGFGRPGFDHLAEVSAVWWKRWM